MPVRRSTPPYFLVGPGHARAIVQPPADAVARHAWRQWLTGLIATLAFAAATGLLVAAGAGPSPTEATARLEHLAAKVARAPVIDPYAAQEIERLVGQPGYDCSHVACSGDVAARNAAARARLATLLAEKTSGAMKTAGAQ